MMINNTGKLRSALAKLIDACGKMVCDTPEAMEMGQAALEAKRVLDAPEDKAGPAAAGDWPMWQVRYSKVPHHEGELTLAVYDDAGNTICRVQPNGNRQQAEYNTTLLAMAPAMRNALAGACTTMRDFGACPYPHCEGCKIGQLKILQLLPVEGEK